MRAIKLFNFILLLWMFNGFVAHCPAAGHPINEDWMPREPEFSRLTLDAKGQRTRQFIHDKIALTRREVLDFTGEVFQDAPVLKMTDTTDEIGRAHV
jgi:hypothetical protein